jgi:hypothetical protein
VDVLVGVVVLVAAVVLLLSSPPQPGRAKRTARTAKALIVRVCLVNWDSSLRMPVIRMGGLKGLLLAIREASFSVLPYVVPRVSHVASF